MAIKKTVAPPAFLPPEWELPDAAAWQAMAKGEATGEQQQRALNWLINNACGTYDLEYRPLEREHVFVSGRRFVGLAVVKMLRLNLATWRKNDVPG